MIAPPHLTAAALGGVRHGFFGRQGGVSSGVYATLNAGAGSKDDPGHVAENRRRIAAALGAQELITLYQIHSARAVRVEAPFPGPPPEADALVTRSAGLAIAVLTADCAPVLLADPTAQVIGAAHAGWKGAVSGVIEACVEAMVEAGARREHIVAAIGPTIGKDSYEVGPEFVDAVLTHAPAAQAFFSAGAGDRAQFDLPAFTMARLRRSGITQVDLLGVDTYAHEEFFSYRRSIHRSEQDYGRNCAAIIL